MHKKSSAARMAYPRLWHISRFGLACITFHNNNQVFIQNCCYSRSTAPPPPLHRLRMLNVIVCFTCNREIKEWLLSVALSVLTLTDNYRRYALHSTCISRFSFLYWCCLCMNIADLWPCSSCCSLL